MHAVHINTAEVSTVDTRFLAVLEQSSQLVVS